MTFTIRSKRTRRDLLVAILAREAKRFEAERAALPLPSVK